MLKNAKTEYFNEHEEIATYLAIETLAEKVKDSETAKLARAIRREEERMANFLQGQIKSLTGAVAREDIPAALRRGTTRTRKPSKAKASKRATTKKPAAKRPLAKAKPAAKRSSGAKKIGSRKKAAGRKGGAAKKAAAKR
jgi:rubrerythrin